MDHPLLERLEAGLLISSKWRGRGLDDERSTDLPRRNAVEGDIGADQVGVGGRIDLDPRLRLERYEQVLDLADLLDVERLRRRFVTGLVDDHRDVARVELAGPRRHTDRRTGFVVDVDRGARWRGVDLHLVLDALRFRVRAIRRLSIGGSSTKAERGDHQEQTEQTKIKPHHHPR
jgi:hypothetical protein